MSDGIQFDEDNINNYRRIIPGQSDPTDPSMGEAGLTGWLIRRGFAKDHNSAQGVMLVIVLINIVIIFFIIRLLIS